VAKVKVAKTPKRGGNVRRAAPADADAGFWDRPVLMNLVADVLYLGGGALLIWGALIALQRLPVFPLRQLVVSEAPRHVSRSQIEQAAGTALSGNFFTIDLATAHSAFVSLPWVRNAELRRRWPDTIELRIEEHEAVARWTPLEGESRLVNQQGEVFVASSDESLPNFNGPDIAAPHMLARFNEFNGRLQAIDKHLVAIQLSSRDAWRVRLNDGLIIDLGRDQQNDSLNQRLTRFVDGYAKLRQRLQFAFNSIDMRYPNGFVVRTERQG
jgi:cell division protein FtsQ